MLDKLDRQDERSWYASQAAEHGWSRNVLTHQIVGQLHRRIGAAPSNFPDHLPPQESDLAQQLVRDPYTFDFLFSDRVAEREATSARPGEVRAPAPSADPPSGGRTPGSVGVVSGRPRRGLGAAQPCWSVRFLPARPRQARFSSRSAAFSTSIPPPAMRSATASPAPTSATAMMTKSVPGSGSRVLDSSRCAVSSMSRSRLLRTCPANACCDIAWR
ncbi:hypothetical protein G352_25837 [Rhodococcus ruber BKS 20-38]|uniref:YhcG N-terminal domain-containing protein n=1 Tax=Rhodococcus ruber BKS 20-38 TaxID=1278076 RepID=M2XQS2_9NOCA|nr:hypothetical protein G352_25837 [Rhodococcus ruber BKS 20-38]